MARHRADWSELHPEILFLIAGRLEMRDDIRHFRAVCKQWRSSTPQIPSNLPFLSPLFPHKFSTTPSALSKPFEFHPLRDHGCFLVIVANTTYLLQHRQHHQNPNYLKPWLVTVEELNPGRFILRKPLTRLAIKTWSEKFPRAFNLCDYNVREIRKAYNFRFSGEPLKKLAINCTWDNNKVILFSNPASASLTVDDCYALFLYNNGTLLSVRLRDEKDYGYLKFVSKPCFFPSSQSLLHSEERVKVSRFDDIVNYKDGVWAIDRKGRVYVIHYSNVLKLVLFSNDTVCRGRSRDTRKRLVESSEGLYLIHRYNDGVDLILFRVYKLNEGERKWDEVKSLNGRILFVSTDCCFFASAEDFPTCAGNCIFFPRDHFPDYERNTYPDEFYFRGAWEELEIGVFHLDDGESGLISHYPGYSDIFWPPPKQLFLNQCSSRQNEKQRKDSACQHSREEEKSPPILELAKEGQVEENSSKETVVESHQTPAMASQIQASKSGPSTVNFQGVEVRSELVPILEKIWAKYGNVAESRVLRSAGLVSRALESLAEAVLVLSSTSGKPLDQSQTDTLRDTLADLQGFKFRVDWLVPFIDKAFACERSKSLVDSFECTFERLLDLEKNY